MREIQASHAEARFPQILDEVERGETVLIMRHGRPIARIVPEAHRNRETADRAIDRIKARRTHAGNMTLEELLALRHEGHNY